MGVKALQKQESVFFIIQMLISYMQVFVCALVSFACQDFDIEIVLKVLFCFCNFTYFWGQNPIFIYKTLRVICQTVFGLLYRVFFMVVALQLFFLVDIDKLW